RRDQRPDLHMTGISGANGGMVDRLVEQRQASAHFGVGEYQVDGRQYVADRAEGMAQQNALESSARFADPFAEGHAGFGKGGGLGPLKGIDRLFLVADSENGAVLVCTGGF